MNQIEAAIIIRDQEGNCNEPIFQVCTEKCPAYTEYRNKKLASCFALWESKNISKLQWFENWLAENDKENVMRSDKIQFENCNTCRHKDLGGIGYPCTHCSQNFKNKWESKKSELQQRVEEVEDYYRIFKQKDYNMDCEYAFMRDALISHNQLIQLFKKDHPEFKHE